MDQQQINTAQRDGAVKNSTWKRQEKPLEHKLSSTESICHQRDGRLSVGHVVHSGSAVPELHGSTEKLLLVTV